MDQLERLLRLVMLLTANTYYTVYELAERMETSPRSIYRYLDTFKSAGFVIYKEDGCIRLGKESPFFKDIYNGCWKSLDGINWTKLSDPIGLVDPY